eukprot:1192162-Amphidinium_carterae.2
MSVGPMSAAVGGNGKDAPRMKGKGHIFLNFSQRVFVKLATTITHAEEQPISGTKVYCEGSRMRHPLNFLPMSGTHMAIHVTESSA